jgi:putative Holliday junction resolvase
VTSWSDRRRVLGIDPGTRRIGVAIGVGSVASPLTVIERGRSLDEALRRLSDLIAEEEVERVVMGLPIGLDGTEGAAARAARDVARRLARFTTVPVEFHDERLTTVTADRAMLAAGLRAEERRLAVDKVAAAVMLQSWLDSQRGAGDDHAQ